MQYKQLQDIGVVWQVSHYIHLRGELQAHTLLLRAISAEVPAVAGCWGHQASKTLCPPPW